MDAGIARPTKLLIGGELVAGGDERLAVENPFTTETIAELGAASPEQVNAAVAAAREAWGGWSRMTAGERCELLHEVARRLREHAEAFQETKHVHMESRIERKEWWYPYWEYGAPPGDGAGA